jgi:hypothetical protein
VEAVLEEELRRPREAHEVERLDGLHRANPTTPAATGQVLEGTIRVVGAGEVLHQSPVTYLQDVGGDPILYPRQKTADCAPVATSEVGDARPVDVVTRDEQVDGSSKVHDELDLLTAIAPRESKRLLLPPLAAGERSVHAHRDHSSAGVGLRDFERVEPGSGKAVLKDERRHARRAGRHQDGGRHAAPEWACVRDLQPCHRPVRQSDRGCLPANVE